MSVAEQVAATRTVAGLFALAERGLVEVRGGDRARFLQGQLTNDVAGLDPAGPRSGCHALVLTPQGRIVAELHVLARPDAFWLETDAESVAALIARLAKYVIADDVELVDRSGDFARFGVEGPCARTVVEAAIGSAFTLAPDGASVLALAGAEVVAASFGWSGEEAVQLLVPAAARREAEAALRRAAAAARAVWAEPEALEVLRIEAGCPRFGAELSEAVLPAEVGLVGTAVSLSKGCYTGQEVVARMHSRGRVGHRLVGLSLELAPRDALPARGAALVADGRQLGELTSAARSPTAGAIALGFARSGRAEPGTRLLVEGVSSRVVELPFVAPSRVLGCV